MTKQCPICKKIMDEEIIKACDDARGWIIAAVKRDHPEWVASDGSCPRCLASYQELGKSQR